MFIPYQAIMIPLTQFNHWTHLTGSIYVLVFAHVIYGIPICTLIFRNYYAAIPNEIIEAGYKLTLNEQRVVLACIAQVNSAEKLLVTDKFELSAKDFAQLFSISEDRAYSELQSIAKTLTPSL